MPIHRDDCVPTRRNGTPGEKLIQWHVPDVVSNKLSYKEKISLLEYLEKHFGMIADMDSELIRRLADTADAMPGV